MHHILQTASAGFQISDSWAMRVCIKNAWSPPQNAGRLVTLKKTPYHRYFSMNIATFLRAPILNKVCKWLFLIKVSVNFQWFMRSIPNQLKYSLNPQLSSDKFFEWLISILKTMHCIHTVYIQLYTYSFSL